MAIYFLLLHYIVSKIQQQHPDLINFYMEKMPFYVVLAVTADFLSSSNRAKLGLEVPN